MRFTLEKNTRTIENHLVLYHDGEEFRLPNQGKQAQVSRLANWRQLLGKGRDVEVFFYKDRPIQAQLRLKDTDPKVWDSVPVQDLEWVVFWTALHRIFVEARLEKKATKGEGDAEED